MSDYLTSAALLATIGVTSPSAQQTSDAQASATTASRTIDNLCNRRFYADSDANQVRYYSPVRWDLLDTTDIITLTSLVSRDDGGNVDTNDGGLNTWTLNTDYVLAPLNASENTADEWPFTSIQTMPLGNFTFNTFYPRSVKLTGKFGWSSVPAAIVDATMLIAERLYKMKREAPQGVVVVEQTAIRIARMDSNVSTILGPYMRHRAAVG